MVKIRKKSELSVITNAKKLANYVTQVLDIDQLPHTQEIAELLKQKTWN